MAVSLPARAHVARPELTAGMAELMARGGLLVVAGAGYGKTTAIEEALERWGGSVAWIGMTERERDGGRLLVGLLDALDLAVPGVAAPARERLAAGGPVDAVDVERRLLVEIDRLLVEPLALVVDDAERLAGDPGALELLGTLLRARTERLRVVIASRRPLELGIAKARAAGRVHEVGEPDLVFSSEECAALLEATLGREPAPAEVVERMEATLGWPLGVALGAPAGDDPEHALRAFLVEEVLDRLEPGLRAAVLGSAAVDELTPGLLDALGLDRDFFALAPTLGLPLRPVNTRRDAYAFHPLVREVLRGRWCQEVAPEDRRALLARVAGPLERAGRALEAIDALLEAQQWDEALRPIAVNAPVLLAAAPETVRAWLARLPAGARSAPLARVLAAQLALSEGRPAEAAENLRVELERLEEQDVGVAWSARLVLAESLYFCGRMEETGALADGFGAPAVRTLPAAQAVALWVAIAAAALGRAEQAEELVEAVRRAGGEDAGVLRTWREAHLRAPSGEVEEILARIARELDVADRDPHLWRPDLLLPTAMFLLTAEGRLAEALAHSHEHLRLAEETGARPDIRSLAHELQAWLLVQAGRVQEAEAALEASRVALPEAWTAAWFDATAALIAHARGEADASRRAAGALEAMAAAPVMLAAIGAFSLLPVIAEVDPARAEEAIGRLLDRLAVTHPGERGRFHRARLLAQRAWARHLAGDRAGAREDLSAALDEAQDMREPLLRADWSRLRELAPDALADGLDPDLLIRPLEAAVPSALLELAAHETPAVRARAAGALARSGHREAIGRLADLAAGPDPQVARAAQAALEQARRQPPPRVFTLLGGFGLRRGEWPVEDREWERPMAQRLVRLLLVRREEPVLEDELLEAFWRDKPAKSARASLQVAVSRARAVLDPAGSETSAIRSAAGAYRLVLDARDRVDADAFEQAAGRALAERGGARRALLERAARLWTGEPLWEDRYADWARPFRERLENRHLEVLRELLAEHLLQGDNRLAVEVAHRALEADPVHEGVHRALMVAYARTGRRGRALRQYLECRRALVDELGIEPGEETSLLQRRILAGAAV